MFGDKPRNIENVLMEINRDVTIQGTEHESTGCLILINEGKPRPKSCFSLKQVCCHYLIAFHIPRTCTPFTCVRDWSMVLHVSSSCAVVKLTQTKWGSWMLLRLHWVWGMIIWNGLRNSRQQNYRLLVFSPKGWCSVYHNDHTFEQHRYTIKKPVIRLTLLGLDP